MAILRAAERCGSGAGAECLRKAEMFMPVGGRRWFGSLRFKVDLAHTKRFSSIV